MSHARFENLIAEAVELQPAPALTCAGLRATSMVIPMTRASSSSVIVALSPVVPHGTSKRTPLLIWRSTSARMRPSSIEPSALNGVTSAVAQPRIQVSCIAIVHLPHGLLPSGHGDNIDVEHKLDRCQSGRSSPLCLCV